jgi:flagellar protein FliS
VNAGAAYQEAAANAASPVHLVVLLYEQMIKDLRRALCALGNGEVEVRTKEIDHALTVAGVLQATLDMNAGAEVAGNLDRFYNQLRATLLQAQTHASAELLQKQIANLLSLREAWVQVDNAQQPRPVATGAPSSVEPASATNWKA